MAGNVATAEGADDLCRAGADAVKVGVGPGSVCTTRVVAGVGVPQLSAVDGGARGAAARTACRSSPTAASATPGDAAKAIAAGAETVMVGNLLAGTEESPGTTVTRDGRPVKVYRGMASAAAAARRMAVEGVEPPEGTEFTEVVPEGVESTVPYRGPVERRGARPRRRPALGHELQRRAHDRGVPGERALRAHHGRGPGRVACRTACAERGARLRAR